MICSMEINMKIAIFTDTYLPDINGVATSSYILHNELVKHGHQVLVITTSLPKDSDYVDDDDIYRLSGLTVKKMYGYRASGFYSFRGMNVIKNFAPDIIHIQTEFGIGTFGRIAGKLLDIPIVYTYHTQYGDYSHYLSNNIKPVDDALKKFIETLTRLYGESCSHLIVPSEKTASIIRSYGIKNDISVIATGLELDRFALENCDLNLIEDIKTKYHLHDRFVMIYLGRIAQEKSIDLLIDGIDRLSKEMNDICLMIVGGGPELNALNKKVDDLKLNDYVIFTGPKVADVVPCYYHSANLFVGASTSETQGLTYIEAMACGLPVLARYDKNLEDVVNENVNGYFFNTLDQFCEKVKEIKSKHLDTFQENAIETSKHYSSDAFYRKILNTYQKVILENDYEYTVKEIKPSKSGYLVQCVAANGQTLNVKVSQMTFKRFGLMNGMILNNEEISALQDLEQVDKCYKQALGYLSYHDYSYENMKKRLANTGLYDDLQIDMTMEHLMQKNLINDYAYARDRFDSLLKKGYGMRKAVAELRKDGIKDSLIDQILDDYSGDVEFEKAVELVRKYYRENKTSSPKALLVKMRNRLFRRGFSQDVIEKAINSVDFDFNDEHTRLLLEKEYERVYKRYKPKYEKRLLKTKIITFLIQKGYEYEDIVSLIEDVWEEENVD